MAIFGIAAVVSFFNWKRKTKLNPESLIDQIGNANS